MPVLGVESNVDAVPPESWMVCVEPDTSGVLLKMAESEAQPEPGLQQYDSLLMNTS